ncbi:MAG: hypothetical protein SOZ06_05150 [Candidatus Faecenecus gallistercoris]|nr:hypothetical protein [Bacillota bacterium]MDD7102124.1 hypothetical protein [Bacillota bacterium]MDY4051332.1 hypothetical protein [Candidatus Faecenecus gallistercoris]
MKISSRFKVTFFCCLVTGLFLVLIGSSYSLVTDIQTGAIDAEFVNASLKLTGSTNVEISNNQVVSDLDGMREKQYTFELVNQEKHDVSYTLYLQNNEDVFQNCTTPCSFLEDTVIRYSLRHDDTILPTLNLDSSRIIDSGVIKAGETIPYSLTLWVSAEDDGTMFYGTITATGIVMGG